MNSLVKDALKLVIITVVAGLVHIFRAYLNSA